MVDLETKDSLFELKAGKSDMPGRQPCHPLLMALYALAVFTAFWQHGHLQLTLSAMGATLLFGLTVYVPKRFFNDLARWIAQTAVMLFAALWAVYRFKECKVEPDVIFTEFLCLAGVSFWLSADSGRYKFINGIALVLVFYGAVFPRSAYIYAFPLLLFLGLLVLYLTRSAALSGSFALASPKRMIRRNWSFMLLHAAIVLGVFMFIYLAFPFEGVRTPGIVLVSFKNNNESYVPEDLNKWMNGKRFKADEKSGKLLPGENPSEAAKNSTVVSESVPLISDSLASGNGPSSTGDKLLFRVFSPIKLYWACRMYDVYDGSLWKASGGLERGRNKYNDVAWSASESVEQKFRLEEWFSSSLPTAYMPVSFAPDLRRKLKTAASSYGYHLAPNELAPEAPFTYSVVSRLPLQGVGRTGGLPVLLESAQPDSASSVVKQPQGPVWSDAVPRKSYLALPAKKISARLKALPDEICAKADSPYAKALAVRDWLRISFKYEQFASAPPEGFEPVDYFIFELKKGHCEYFASAMAVLCRLEGLPARVVTGFSPGNFDALNKCFEVYEYHAHAWTQVYIDGPGWLTFDATPPGQLVSRTTPLGLGTLQDPFGDEWKIVPPELSKETQRYLNVKRAESLAPDPVEKAISAPAAEALLGTLMKIPMNREEIGDAIRDFKTQKSVKDATAKKGELSKFDAIKLNFGLAVDSARRALRRAAEWLFGFNGLTLAAIAVVVLLLRAALVSLRERSKLDKRAKAAFARLDVATSLVACDPVACISQCYKMTRELLELAGFPRTNNIDLFDYGKSLAPGAGSTLSTEALVLFFIYSRSIYGSGRCTREDSAEALRRAIAIREQLARMLKG